ncbi:hypothetical protein V3468_05410 [Flavobacterium oreochromis]|uniref:Serine acetyltransferase n=1 Tax=Flavobacterium oreochromis TaxID=2906078 RepID=A0ABW8P7Y1_9FLAO|nr:hypothetical protein [Flavobacterium oreochromis]OWP76035.1 hypothetical protein BWG23_09040 [Flavobacterium oreochromis]POR23993.1 hypothetical protein BWK58_09260 [Flavobacterium columnare]QYS86589.1 hypothetical protein JJC03_00435 [Flavobacterium oreochromis]
MKEFIDFLLTKVFQSRPIPHEILEKAFKKTILDINYHFPDLTENEIKSRIQTNNNELAVFLFRIGSEIHLNKMEELKFQIHWLLKELCSCEVYFNNEIDLGFYIVHGEGTIIGSRNKIGKGFKIHQGCTVGHKKNGEGKGNKIGNDVVMYANSSIIGELEIGNNVIIGAHVMIVKNVLDDKIIISKIMNIQK